MTGALAGADVGARRRHQLRGAVPAHAAPATLDSAACAPAGRTDAWPPRTLHARRVAAAARRAADERDRRRARASSRGAAASAAAVLWLARQPLFAIRVDQRRRRRRPQQRARRSAPTPRRKLAGNFLTIDLARCARAFESVPWVRQAVVRRVWPNRLRVQLEEHRAGRAVGRRASGERQARQQLRRGVRGQRRRRRGRRPADARAAPTAARRTCWRCIGRAAAGVRAARTRASRRSRCRAAARGRRRSTAAPWSSSAAAATTRCWRARARFVATLPQVTVALPARRSSTPTCATPTATRCG